MTKIFQDGLARAFTAVLFMASISIFPSVLGSGEAHAQQKVGCSVKDAVTTCTVNQPTVTQRLTEYPIIHFQPGDTVAVSAKGCAQTGGHGKTWKLYVSPQGSGSDRLYHGLIWIPGVTSGLVRVEGLNGRTVSIPSTFPVSSSNFLRLGYEDDDYSDNGYWGHDDGDNDQCKNVGPAVVELTIRHQAGSTGSPAEEHKPMDLVASAYDANLLFDNPRWFWSTQHAGGVTDWVGLCTTSSKVESARCTSQSPSTDVIHDGIHWPGLCSGDYGIDGHLNWMAATYQGQISFENHDSPLTGDDDYNMDLIPSGNAGLVTGNDGSLHLEFDSDETVDHFRQAWWQNFHHLVDSSTEQAEALVSGKHAIVSGLVGLDLVHDPATEIHPVYALGIETNEDPADQTWVMFVRNFGDEGECSQYQHFLDLPGRTYTFSIPWMSGAASFTVTKQDFQTRSDNPVSGPLVEAVGQGASRHIEVTFQLPAPEAQAHTDGELHIRWIGPVNRLLSTRAQVARKPMSREREVGAPETVYAEGVQHLPPARFADYRAKLPSLLRPEVRQDAVQAPELHSRAPRSGSEVPAVRNVSDSRVSDRQDAQRRTLCSTLHSSEMSVLGALKIDCRP